MSDISNNLNDVITALNNKSDIDLGNTILDTTVKKCYWILLEWPTNI